MKRSNPNIIFILTILFGAFITISATSQMVSNESVISSSDARSATLYSYQVNN